VFCKQFVVPVLFAVLASQLGPASAQNYPSRIITIVVPYPPGGPTSETARLVAAGMAERLGQPVIVENVSGAGGNLGVAYVARAATDGHTLLVHNMALATSVSLFPNLPFNVERDLTGIALLNFSPIVIAGRKSLPANTFAELLTWMKAAPAIKFAHGGIGNVGHLCAALFANTVGVQVDMIPYRGGAQIMQDFIGEHFDLGCPTAQFAIEPIRAGLIKGYAVTSRERYDPLPELPSIVEAGMPNVEILYWHGLYAPAGTPKPIIDKLNAAVRDVLADPKIVAAWARTGIVVYPAEGQSPQAATDMVRSEAARWGQVIRDNKIEAGQ
jgi:tripartite-type tricarboxylate transporter receptor subunit TctC